MFCEGLRGIGSLQVLLAHIFSLFMPVFARMQPGVKDSLGQKLAHSPVYFLTDGSLAVFAFFLMSGFVLGHSFLHADLPVWRQVYRRIIRLYIPVLAALVLAIILLTLMPNMREHMELINPTDWLSKLYQFDIGSAYHLTQDILLNSMFIGYTGASVFQFATPWASLPIVGLQNGLNPPLWTLHVEFWGSLLTLAIAKTYLHVWRPIFWLFLLLALAATAPQPISFFIIGFLSYLWRVPLMGEKDTLFRSILSTLLLVLSILISSYGPLEYYFGALVEKEIAGLTAFLAISISPRMRRQLSLPWLVRLGRVSFSLYLTHFPILFTIGIAVFLPLERQLGYIQAAWIAGMTCIVLSFLVCIPFERFIDRPSIRLASYIGRKKSDT